MRQQHAAAANNHPLPAAIQFVFDSATPVKEKRKNRKKKSTEFFLPGLKKKRNPFVSIPTRGINNLTRAMPWLQISLLTNRNSIYPSKKENKISASYTTWASVFGLIVVICIDVIYNHWEREFYYILLLQQSPDEWKLIGPFYYL